MFPFKHPVSFTRARPEHRYIHSLRISWIKQRTVNTGANSRKCSADRTGTSLTTSLPGSSLISISRSFQTVPHGSQEKHI